MITQPIDPKNEISEYPQIQPRTGSRDDIAWIIPPGAAHP
jgi:hypothetical protein